MSSPSNLGISSLSLYSPVIDTKRLHLVSSLKRKRSQSLHPDDGSTTSSSKSLKTPSISSSLASKSPQLKRTPVTVPIQDTGLIRCICGYSEDDGLSIYCDMCGYWQHILCVLYEEPSGESSSQSPASSAMNVDLDARESPTPEASTNTASPSDTRRSQSPISISRASSKVKSKAQSSAALRHKPFPTKTPLHSIPTTLPEEWICERCIPRPVDARGARQRQLDRLLADRVASTTDEGEDVDVEYGSAASTSAGISSTVSAKRKRRKSNATIAGDTAGANFPTWGGPPPPRRSSTKQSSATFPTAVPSSKKSRAQSMNSPINTTDHGLSKRDEDTVFEPWATEYTHISDDVIPDRRVRAKIDEWAQTLMDDEDAWYITPAISPPTNGLAYKGAPNTVSPLTSCIPLHRLPLSNSTAPPSRAVRVQVRAISTADCNSVPSPTVCPVSPMTPYPSSLVASPLPETGGNPFDLSVKSGSSGPPFGSNYARPPTYGLYTACPTAHAQSQAHAQAQAAAVSSTVSIAIASLAPTVYHTSSIPPGTLLAPYPSCITTLTAYADAPSSQYSLLQTAKPYVRLVGNDDMSPDGEHGVALALDAREMGGEGRWARCGCFPNAVIRPMFAFAAPDEQSHKKLKKGGQVRVTLSWGIYSTRNIAPRGEEIVLGWEWDRASAVHRLRNILRDGCSNSQEETEVRTQVSNILYTLGGTFASCACGRQQQFMPQTGAAEPMRECVFVAMARFVSERSSYIGKPCSGLGKSSLPILSHLSSSTSNLSRLSKRAPLLTLDGIAQYTTSVDLGPMVGWPEDDNEQQPFGIMLGIRAHVPPVFPRNRPAFLPQQQIRQKSPLTPVSRPSTPPPPSSLPSSHSAPPHMSARSAMDAIYSSKEARAVTPPRSSSAFTTHTVSDSPGAPGALRPSIECITGSSLLASSSPSAFQSTPPSPSSSSGPWRHQLLPRIRTSDGESFGTDGRDVLHASVTVRPPTPASSGLTTHVRPRSASSPLTTDLSPRIDSAAFEASLSSSLGLDVDMHSEADKETASNAMQDVPKLPPWARKRVSSSESLVKRDMVIDALNVATTSPIQPDPCFEACVKDEEIALTPTQSISSPSTPAAVDSTTMTLVPLVPSIPIASASTSTPSLSEKSAAPVTPAAPPVRMSFLDWKRKREEDQVEKEIEETPGDRTASTSLLLHSQAAVTLTNSTLIGIDADLKLAMGSRDAMEHLSHSSVLGKDAPESPMTSDTPIRSLGTPETSMNMGCGPSHSVKEEFKSMDHDVAIETQVPKPELLEDYDMDTSSAETSSVADVVIQSPKPHSLSHVSEFDFNSTSSSPALYPLQLDSKNVPVPISRTMQTNEEIKLNIISTPMIQPSSLPGTKAEPPVMPEVKIEPEDAEDGEIIDSSKELSSPIPHFVQPNSNENHSGSSTPSVSSRPTPPSSTRRSSPGYRRASPPRERYTSGPSINGNRYYGASYSSSSPVNSHSSSERDDYRYRDVSSPLPKAQARNVPVAPSRGYSRRGPGDRWYPPPRRSQSGDRRNGWGREPSFGAPLSNGDMPTRGRDGTGSKPSNSDNRPPGSYYPPRPRPGSGPYGSR